MLTSSKRQAEAIATQLRDELTQAYIDLAGVRAELSAAKREVERLDRANERLWGRFEAEQRRMAELNLQAMAEQLKPTLPPEDDAEEDDAAFKEYEELRTRIEKQQESGHVVANKKDAPDGTTWFGDLLSTEEEEVTLDA